jgi:hypothetical protein
MKEMLSRQTFIVNEQPGFARAILEINIFDLVTRQLVLKCYEPNMDWITRIFRYTPFRSFTPYDFDFVLPNGNRELRVKINTYSLGINAEIFGKEGEVIGKIVDKFLHKGPHTKFTSLFTMYNSVDRPLFDCTGHNLVWKYNFVQNDQKIARITKKWNGLENELLNGPNKYILHFLEPFSAESIERKLIFASVPIIAWLRSL